MQKRVLLVCALSGIGCKPFDGKNVVPELPCDPKRADCVPCDPALQPGCATGGDGAVSSMGVIGKACSDASECVAALRLGCVDGHCALTGDLPEGSACSVTGECGSALYCAVEKNSQCSEAGAGTEATRCAGTEDCARGLVCTFAGLTRLCAASGEGDLGTPCTTTSDCLAGLVCPPPGSGLPERTCIPTPGPDQLQPIVWSGVACAEDSATPTAYFHVPRGDGSDKDFYRLPFPNDVRLKKGALDLTGFPSPGNLLGLGDVVGSYVKASERDLDGFATNPVVYFRFSRPYASSTVHEKTVVLYDIDPDSPGRGRTLARSWGTSSGDLTPYICENWLNVRTAAGFPLSPGTTYAVVLTTGIAPKAGDAFERDADLDTLLASAEPGDATLAAAHVAYAPLRALIAEGKLNSADVLNAAVFTTQSPQDVIARLHTQIASGPAPSVSDVTVCDTGVTSPCDDGAERVCAAANGNYVEVHGRIKLPIYQTGEAPYLSEGGAVKRDASGSPVAVRSEDVCFGLALPKSAPPQSGYALAIYGHGTGGSFKAGLSDLGTVASSVGAAVLTIDLPEHGKRKGDSSRGSDELFFNFLNPDAALGNVLQGSADLMSLVTWVRRVDAPANSDFGQVVRFDAARIVLFGHSQGATHASLVLPHESGLVGAVLSGLGGDLSEALSTKRSPIDIAGAMPILLADPSARPFDAATCARCLGSHHPVYALLQMFFERVDPVNFAGGLAKPPPGGTAKHVFMTYGLGDTYAPEVTQKAYVVGAGLPHVGVELAKLHKNGPTSAPQSGNVTVGNAVVTQGVSQYRPKDGADGHFVYLEAGRPDWERFLKALLQGQTPSIGQ